MRFLVLGPLEVRDGDRSLQLTSAKQRVLLATLLVHANAVVSVDRLGEILWGDAPPADVAGTLQNYVSRLRALLEPGRTARDPATMLLTRAPGYLLRVDQHQVDARRFEQLVAEGRVALREGHAPAAAERLGEALDLWRGAALAEFADQPFAQAEAVRLDELRLSAIEDRIGAELTQGRHDEVIGDLEAAARDNPLRERLWARWMLALYRCGRQAEALRVYQELRARLDEELGITPSPELVALEEAIVLQKPELDWVPSTPRARGAVMLTAGGGTDREHPAGMSGSIGMPRTRYAQTRDGVHIAYQVLGDGPFDLVEVGGFVSHLEFAWEGPEYAHLLRRLASFARVICFDKRGTGMSDPVPVHELPSLEQRMDDFRAVMDAVGSEQAALFGESEGGQMAALFAATYPERTRALVTYGSYARIRHAPDYPPGLPDADLDAFASEMEATWGEIPERSVWARNATRDPRFRDWLGRWARNAASPGAAATLLRMDYEVDVRSVLPAIRVPTLVLHRVDDPLVGVEHGRYFAAHIPGAKYVELPGDDRLVFAGDVDRLVDEIEAFLTGHHPEPGVNRVLATLVFVDIVEPRAPEPGAQRGREERDGHAEVVRREVERFGGREVASERGFLAAFDGPARAVQYALAVTEVGRSLGLELHLGVHTGECEQRGTDLGGIALDIAAQIADLARPGEVRVSRTVTDLVVGSHLTFANQGEHQLEGVPGRWHLFAVQAP